MQALKGLFVCFLKTTEQRELSCLHVWSSREGGRTEFNGSKFDTKCQSYEIGRPRVEDTLARCEIPSKEEKHRKFAI